MQYREIKPDGFLKNFVQCFWYHETAGKEIVHTILPDGCFDLIGEFENDMLQRVKLTGVWTKPKDIHIQPQTKFFAVRFKLLAAEYLFRRELKSILDTMQLLPHDFWGMGGYQSNEFEQFAANTAARIHGALRHLEEIDSRKLRLFDLIYRQQLHTVAELSRAVFWSSRQINRYFNAQFGFSLKEFMRIVRFKSSFNHLSRGMLYPENRYFDQAHFIREVRKYSGVTPKELYRNRNGRFLQLSTQGRR